MIINNEKVIVAVMKKRKYKNKSRGLINSLQVMMNNKLIISIISGIMMVVSATLLHVYNGIQNDLNLLNDKVTDVIGANEEAYVTCTSFLHNPIILTYFQQKSFFDARKNIRGMTENLLKQRSLLGKHISRKTYDSTAELICLNNSILNSGLGICKISTIDSDKLTLWRKEMQENIGNDKLKHQQAPQIIKDFVEYTVTFFSGKASHFDQVYEAPVCNIDKIISKHS